MSTFHVTNVTTESTGSATTVTIELADRWARSADPSVIPESACEALRAWLPKPKIAWQSNGDGTFTHRRACHTGDASST